MFKGLLEKASNITLKQVAIGVGVVGVAAVGIGVALSNGDDVTDVIEEAGTKLEENLSSEL